MGCDIHIHAEKKTESGYEIIDQIKPFDNRSYGTFGFLAGVRNYSDVTPISQPRGIPDDVSPPVKHEHDGGEGDAHSASWLSVEELSNFDYDQLMEDRRVMRNNNGGCTCDAGEGQSMSYREFLGEGFFKDIEILKESEATRIVFWFDN